MGGKLLAPDYLEESIKEIRKQSKTIVTLNGSFDLLHVGHLEMIYQASLQGDILIIGLNTDRSIREYKNPKRPIIPLEQRVMMVAALFMVDYVTWFDETDPREMLKKIRPDVHANGSEYGLNCIEAEVVKESGGRIHIIPLVPGFSTSKIIEKINCL
ncbi:MAG: adenylyltransferase/cytidyltransferase family protein [Verrucomicrobia bacterium]|nr:adenylyltransferase/cytidyltransferase family protein [Verrucomicrobiota bacterium]